MVGDQTAHQLVGRRSQSVLQAPLAEGRGMAQPRLMQRALGGQGAQQNDQGANQHHRQGIAALRTPGVRRERAWGGRWGTGMGA